MRRLVTVVAIAAMLGCGPPPPEPARVVALPDPEPVAIAKAETKPRPDLDRAAPDDLEVVFRINDMDQVRGELASALPQIGSIVGASSLDGVLALVLGNDIAGVVDASYPLDVASFGKHGVVLSFGVRADLEGKLAESFELQNDDGVMTIKRSSHPHGALKECAFFPATKPAMRVVCSDDAGALKSGGSYLARVVSGEPMDADVKLRVTSRVLDGGPSAQSRHRSSPIIDALGDAFRKDVDVDRAFEVDLRFKSDIELTATLRMKHRTSALARALVPAKAALPPPAFFRLPKDVVAAAAIAGGAPEDLKPLRDALRADFLAAMKTDGYDDGASKRFADEAEKLFLTGGPIVLATGIGESGVTGVEKAVLAVEGAKDKKAAESKLQASLAPWFLGWVDEPTAKWTDGIKTLVKIADDSEKTRNKDIARAAPPKDPQGTNTRLRLPAKPDPKWHLPQGSLEVLVDKTARATNHTTTAHVFVVPKGTGTWFGYGEDASIVAARLRGVLDDKNTAVIAAKELANERSVGTALVAPLGVITATHDGSASSHRLQQMLERAGKTSSKGRDVLAIVATSEITDDRAALRLRTSVSRRALADLFQIVNP